MPKLNKILGLPLKPFLLFFYSNESNEPAHVHIEHTQGGECKFWLAPLELAKNWDMPSHLMNACKRLVEEHQQQLIQLYDDYQSQRSN